MEPDTKNPSCAILLMAAGASRRMRGADKLLQPVGRTTLLRDRVLACLGANAGRVLVVLPQGHSERIAELAGLNVEIIEANDSSMGLAHSLSAGLSQVTEDMAMIVLSDLPDLTSEDLNTVLRTAQNSDALIVRGTTQAHKPGHPVIVKRVLYAELNALEGDHGGQTVLRKYEHRTVLVELPDQHALSDLDTPEDWKSWRENQS